MSGSQTSPTDDTTAQLAQIMQMIQGQQQAPPAQPTQERSFVSLLGSALGGGSASPMATADEEAAGKRALMNFGINMLAAGGPSTTRVGFGQALARGLAGAGESEAASEGVAAARLGAQQDYQTKQQELQLARLKEAIPLLTLQQQRKLMGLPTIPSSIGGGGAPSIGAAGGPDPVAGLPKDQALAAIAQRESGNQNIFSNIKVEGYSQDQLGSGYYQIIPSTWREGAKLAGVDTTKYPLAINAPREVQDKVASALWDKYGAKPWAQSAPRAAPGGTGTATAATPPPATPTPPAASTAPARETFVKDPATGTVRKVTVPVQPSPAAPPEVIQTDQPAGGATVAGPPGTAIVGAAKPAGPAVSGDVNTMIRGMIGAGANATTLAPGAATSGPVAPPAVVAAATPQGATPPATTTTPPVTPTPQVTTQAAQPSGPPAFQYVQHDPPPGILPPSSLTADEQSVVADARRSYATAIQASDRLQMVDPAKAAELRSQAEATLQGTLDKELSARTGRTKEAGDALKEWYANDYKTQADANKAAVDNYYQNQNTQTKLENDLRVERERGEQARQTGAASSENQYVLDQRKQFAGEQDSTRNAIQDYQMLRLFSDAAGTSTPIDNIQIGDKTGRDMLVQYGFGTQAQREKWGAQQAFNAVINKSILAARQGVSMGQLSDRDMNFLQHMTVSQLQDPQTRSDVISYLEQSAYRKQQYMDRVEQLWDGGKGVTWGNARTQAQNEMAKTDIVPHVPDNFGSLTPALQQQFIQQNQIQPGSLVRLSDGKLGRYEVGK